MTPIVCGSVICLECEFHLWTALEDGQLIAYHPIVESCPNSNIKYSVPLLECIPIGKVEEENISNE